MLTINYEHVSQIIRKLEKMEEEDDFTIDCTQEEVEALTEKLLDNDENNCARFFRYKRYTEPEIMACTWFGEIRSCALNNSRNKFHQTTYKPYFQALYIVLHCISRRGGMIEIGMMREALLNQSTLSRLPDGKI